jgi:hypothetical protein
MGVASMSKANCWEFKKCDRQPGGKLAGEYGVCPAATNDLVDGIHGGKNAGRACWVVAGTFCDGTVQGTEAQKQHKCRRCDFFKCVKKEESPSGFLMSILEITKGIEKS